MSRDSNSAPDLSGVIYVFGVTSLILFISFSSQYFVFYNLLSPFGAIRSNFFAIFNLLTAYILYMYYLACTTEPGTIPKLWHKDSQYKIKPRFCTSCQEYKPPRSHHCSECRRCVLKMDHHCPWTNNCVGFYNQGHFLRFLISVVVTCSIAMCLHSYKIYQFGYNIYYQTFKYPPASFKTMFFVSVNLFLLFFVILFVGIMAIQHFFQLKNNTTTIEKSEINRVEKLISDGKISQIKYPYNLGDNLNFQQVFGDNLYFFWLPSKMQGDGINYLTCYQKQEDLPLWPPLEYYKAYPRSVTAKNKGRTSIQRILYSNQDSVTISMFDEDGENVIRTFSNSEYKNLMAMMNNGQIDGNIDCNLTFEDNLSDSQRSESSDSDDSSDRVSNFNSSEISLKDHSYSNHNNHHKQPPSDLNHNDKIHLSTHQSSKITISNKKID
ncbi:hypothetical protein BB561_002998 [Smittium simulii]|uniref:Palmitoyltransferase n=1 Tax=Smittium simulii TaxID=133385 RepID=A0A2T9YNB2_9FUNG|nr:hypothetical protein BB561_002998 [Smittium simulii]